MEFQEVVRRRRMIRRYKPDPIPEEVIERIASTALRGPSAGFSQGIDVTVVTEKGMWRRIVEALTDKPAEEIPVFDAPVLLIITSDEDRYHRRYNEPDKLAITGGKEIHWPVPFWFVDAGAAMMLVLLSAVDEGLAAGFFGHPDQIARFQEILEMPPNAIPIGVIAIGYDAEGSLSPEAKERFRTRRRPKSEAIHWERW